VSFFHQQALAVSHLAAQDTLLRDLDSQLQRQFKDKRNNTPGDCEHVADLKDSKDEDDFLLLLYSTLFSSLQHEEFDIEGVSVPKNQ